MIRAKVDRAALRRVAAVFHHDRADEVRQRVDAVLDVRLLRHVGLVAVGIVARVFGDDRHPPPPEVVQRPLLVDHRLSLLDVAEAVHQGRRGPLAHQHRRGADPFALGGQETVGGTGLAPVFLAGGKPVVGIDAGQRLIGRDEERSFRLVALRRHPGAFGDHHGKAVHLLERQRHLAGVEHGASRR